MSFRLDTSDLPVQRGRTRVARLWMRSLLAVAALSVTIAAKPVSVSAVDGHGVLGEVHCTPSEVPFSVTFVVTNAPASGGEVRFDARIESTSPIDRLRLAFTTQGAVQLAAPLDQDLLDLVPGAPRTIAGILQIHAAGGGSLYVGAGAFATTSCGEVAQQGQEFSLHVLDEGTSVRTGGGSVLQLQLERLQQLLTSGTISQDEAFEAYEDLLAATGVPSDESSGTAGSSLGGNVTIDGTARWTDASGGLHPCRHVVVKAYRPGLVFGLNEVASTVTNAAGQFVFSLDPATLGSSPRDITVRVFAENFATRVRNPPSLIIFGGNTYFRERVFVDVADGEARVGEDFTANNVAVQDRAFSIADSLIVGSDYQQAVQGARPPLIACNYPRADAGTASFYSGGEITVHASKPFAWDVLLHEFGHYLADLFDLDNSPGGPHGCSEDLIASQGKSNGSRLAWGEGLGTYLGIAAQLVTNAGALGVPNVGDTSYHSVDANTNAPWQYDNETRDGCNGVGEGVETNVSRALLDVADSAADLDDQLGLGHAALWTTLRGAPARQNLSDAWNAVIAGMNVQSKIIAGKVFAQNRVSPQADAPVDGAALGDMPPTFEWTKNTLNEFQVRFYDESFNEVGVSPDLGDVADWTPTQAEWDAIRNGRNTLVWVIEGRNVDAPETGRYWSGSRKLGGVDFAFVIDDTGSMSQEIGGVRSALLAFLGGFDPGSTDLLFQLTTFKDNVSVRPPTNSIATIESQVNALSAGGGGDCPENSVGGLMQGTRQLKRGGTVLFVTDADPRPGSDLPGLIAQLRATGARVNVLLSGTCFGSLVADDQDPGSPASSDPWVPSDQLGTGFSGAVDAYSQIAAATGGVFAYIPEVNGGGAGPIEYQNTAENILAASLGPRIVSISPSVLRQGARGVVLVQAQNSNFLSATTVDAGAGVSVTAVEPLDAVTLRVTVQVAPDAAIGFRDVAATTVLNAMTTEVAAGIGALQIAPATTTPVLVSADPPVVQPGESTTVDVYGLGTSFDDTSTAAFGAGITVLDVTRIDSELVRVAIEVAPNAQIGLRTVSITTAGDSAVGEQPEFFRVQAELPAIPLVESVDPPQGNTGQMLTVTIRVTDIEVDPAETDVEFSGSGITVHAVVACGPVVVASISIAPGAPPGVRDVLVRSGAVSAIALNAFTVLSGPSSRPFPCFEVRNVLSTVFGTTLGACSLDAGGLWSPVTDPLELSLIDTDSGFAHTVLVPAGSFILTNPWLQSYRYDSPPGAPDVHIGFSGGNRTFSFYSLAGVALPELNGPSLTVRVEAPGAFAESTVPFAPIVPGVPVSFSYTNTGFEGCAPSTAAERLR